MKPIRDTMSSLGEYWGNKLTGAMPGMQEAINNPGFVALAQELLKAIPDTNIRVQRLEQNLARLQSDVEELRILVVQALDRTRPLSPSERRQIAQGQNPLGSPPDRGNGPGQGRVPP